MPIFSAFTKFSDTTRLDEHTMYLIVFVSFRIMLLNLLNLYSLIFALFSKIEGMSEELNGLKPGLNINATMTPNNTMNISESWASNLPLSCSEERVSCEPCHVLPVISVNLITNEVTPFISETTKPSFISDKAETHDVLILNKNLKKSFASEKLRTELLAENLVEGETISSSTDKMETTTLSSILIARKQLELIRNISEINADLDLSDPVTESYDDGEYNSYDYEETISPKSTTPKNVEFDYSLYDDSNSTRSFPSSASTVQEDTSTIFDTNSSNSETTTSVTDETETDNTTEETSTEYSTESMFTESISKKTDSISVTTYYIDEFTTLAETDKPYTEQFSSSSGFFGITNTATTDQESITSFELSPTARTSSISRNISVMTTAQTRSNCPSFFNCTMNCGGHNVTQVFFIANCKIVEKRCYVTKCGYSKVQEIDKSNETAVDVAYMDHNRKMYNLTKATRKKLLKLCWETMFGQELVKLTMMDLVRFSEYLLLFNIYNKPYF